LAAFAGLDKKEFQHSSKPPTLCAIVPSITKQELILLEITNTNGYKVVHLTDGHLIDSAVHLITNKKADGINLNFIRNFPPDLTPLDSALNMKYLQVNDYDHSKAYDYNNIHNLHQLEHLSIYSTDNREIDFQQFPKLESLALMWRPKAKSLFDCNNLKRLFIGKYNGIDLSAFGKLTSLKYLRINTGSIQTLEGIEKLINLEEALLMQVVKLENIVGLEKLRNLKHLRIDNCRKIKNINLLKQLSRKISIEIRGTTPELEDGA
jgi:hypothetical protein